MINPLRSDGQTWIFLGWTLAVTLHITAIMNQRRRLMRLLRRATPNDDPDLRSLVSELSSQIGIRRTPGILLVDDVSSPFVCNPLRPQLVLPRRLVASLAPE